MKCLNCKKTIPKEDEEYVAKIYNEYLCVECQDIHIQKRFIPQKVYINAYGEFAVYGYDNQSYDLEEEEDDNKTRNIIIEQIIYAYRHKKEIIIGLDWRNKIIYVEL